MAAYIFLLAMTGRVKNSVEICTLCLLFVTLAVECYICIFLWIKKEKYCSYLVGPTTAIVRPKMELKRFHFELIHLSICKKRIPLCFMN